MERVEKYKIPIVAIQETHWFRNGNTQSGNSTIFFSGKESGKHEQESFTVSNSIMSGIKLFLPMNGRLCFFRITERFFDIFYYQLLCPIGKPR